MKFLLIISLKLYQAFFPKKFRGKCLFKESCSNYALRKTREFGFLSGIKSIIFRYNNCRPNYYIINGNDKKLIITSRNKVFEEHEINTLILNPKNKN